MAAPPLRQTGRKPVSITPKIVENTLLLYLRGVRSRSDDVWDGAGHRPVRMHHSGLFPSRQARHSLTQAAHYGPSTPWSHQIHSVHTMKILGLLAGPTVEALVEGEQRGLGPIEEVFDLSETRAQVSPPRALAWCLHIMGTAFHAPTGPCTPLPTRGPPWRSPRSAAHPPFLLSRRSKSQSTPAWTISLANCIPCAPM